MRKRLDIKAILRDPIRRKRLMVELIIATQVREGIETTWEQAEAAYEGIRREVPEGACAVGIGKQGWSHNLVPTIVCGYCRTPKKVKYHIQKYCSGRCYGLAQQAHLTPHKRGYCAVMICAWCCEDFIIHRRPSQRNPWMCCSTRCARRLQGWRHCKRHQGGTRGQIEKLHRMRHRGEITLSCVICGFDRLVEWSHIIPASKGGRHSEHNGLWLCPNDHRLFDRHRLSPDEVARSPAHAQTAYRLGRTSPVGPGPRRRATT